MKAEKSKESEDQNRSLSDEEVVGVPGAPPDELTLNLEGAVSADITLSNGELVRMMLQLQELLKRCELVEGAYPTSKPMKAEVERLRTALTKIEKLGT